MGEESYVRGQSQLVPWGRSLHPKSGYDGELSTNGTELLQGFTVLSLLV